MNASEYMCVCTLLAISKQEEWIMLLSSQDFPMPHAREIVWMPEIKATRNMQKLEGSPGSKATFLRSTIPLQWRWNMPWQVTLFWIWNKTSPLVPKLAQVLNNPYSRNRGLILDLYFAGPIWGFSMGEGGYTGERDSMGFGCASWIPSSRDR